MGADDATARTPFWVVRRISRWGSTSIMAEAGEQVRARVMRSNDGLNARLPVHFLAPTAAQPEAWIKEGFGRWRESHGLMLPAGFELLLVPGAFKAAVVHAPIAAPYGIPVPPGFASFDRPAVDRAMALLVQWHPRYGLAGGLLRDLAPDGEAAPESSIAGQIR